eukprot:7377456-Prymnesium_polylepis.1
MLEIPRSAQADPPRMEAASREEGPGEDQALLILSVGLAAFALLLLQRLVVAPAPSSSRNPPEQSSDVRFGALSPQRRAILLRARKLYEEAGGVLDETWEPFLLRFLIAHRWVLNAAAVEQLQNTARWRERLGVCVATCLDPALPRCSSRHRCQPRAHRIETPILAAPPCVGASGTMSCALWSCLRAAPFVRGRHGLLPLPGHPRRPGVACGYHRRGVRPLQRRRGRALLVPQRPAVGRGGSSRADRVRAGLRRPRRQAPAGHPSRVPPAAAVAQPERPVLSRDVQPRADHQRA